MTITTQRELHYRQTPTQSLIGNEKNTMCYMGFYLLPHHVFHPKPFFSLFPSTTAKTCSGGFKSLAIVRLWRQKRLPIALWQIGAQVLVRAHLSFQSHQFIYNVLEYIYADGISAF
jgi:hypothetical protein